MTRSVVGRSPWTAADALVRLPHEPAIVVNP